MFPFRGKTGHIAKSKVCNCKSRVHSVTEESLDERNDHFMVYIVDAVKSSGSRVPVCTEGTMFDMQLDTAADVSLLPESLYQKHLSHLP
ncbi:hypothetical protein NP493_644g03004 [Ridgeia piscesae]|uniref:Uncharacterized protein n=1 Tax=Ridgeia piscesae TaxID=27915 RepID=A0AAD9KSJ5_RIDPI|nr:hypothetical protein NP493_644g03004 [Ridgeia piscesae]